MSPEGGLTGAAASCASGWIVSFGMLLLAYHTCGGGFIEDSLRRTGLFC